VAVSGDLIPTLCRVGVLGNLSDGQLLDRFLDRGSETAETSFSALLDRHGPMVLRVCRQALGNAEDVQDAFQATFLVLASRARSIRSRESLASWLYGIALRVCRRARQEAARRQAHQRKFGLLQSARAGRPAGEGAPFLELHQELERLPEKYRSAVILCYLEGLSTESAARHLGCPRGTVLSRLSRARDRLRTRLTRRGISAPLALLESIPATEALRGDVLRSTTETAMALLTRPNVDALAIAPQAARLTRTLLRSMALTRPSFILASLVTGATLAIGTAALLPDEQAREARAKQTVRTLATQEAAAKEPPHRPPLRDSKAVPSDLAWVNVAPEKWGDVLEMLAARSRANYENIRSWQGTYRIAFSQYLNANTAGMMGARPIQGRIEPLIQEFEFTVQFAADLPGRRYFQDKTTQSMRFRRVSKDEPVTIRNVGPADGRMFTDGTTLVDFNPIERATTAFLPDHPEAQNKRLVRHWTAEESRGRTSPTDSDPRQFFGTPHTMLWTGPQLYADALRGRKGEEQLRQAATRTSLHQAEGRGGIWYWMETRLDGTGAFKSLYHTTIWSPEAGYQPVLEFMAWDQPDGKPSTRTEWAWLRRDGVYIPSKYHRTTYEVSGETFSMRQSAELVDCVLNQPLNPHQFDYEGLGIQNGDVIVDHVKRTVSVWRDGSPVKLGDFVR
jgi:RNA polymerase sigma factor (sigma-70 family)